MFIKFNGASVHYEICGNGTIPIVFLHGWGGSTQSFKFMLKYLDFDYRAIFIDFPPFGCSCEPSGVLTIFDYADMVKEILIKEGIKNPILVGHSFGGRVAIILASKNNFRGLVLTSSAGIKVKHKPSYYFKVYKYKFLKMLGLNPRGGSKDYLVLSTIMQKTFVNIVNTNLEKYAINITVPTLIFWGDKDKETPIYMAKKLHKLIKNSNLFVVKNSGHFAYMENKELFSSRLNDFIKGI